MVVLNVLIVGRAIVFLNHRSVFSFEAPCTVPGDPLVSEPSYIPFVLVLAVVPVFVHLVERHLQCSWLPGWLCL